MTKRADELTKRAEGLREAERASEAVLHRFGVRSAAHIKVEAMASAYGVTIVDGQLDGARARLTRGTKPQIRVSERTPSEAARTFSIAHEFGHHVLGHFGDKPHAVCSEAEPKPYSRHPNKRDVESEAQVFAAGILMPRFLLEKRCSTDAPSLEIVQSISKDFKTSLPASAIRFVELTSACCAAVLTVNGMISWAVHSKSFEFKIARGKKLDQNTHAHVHHNGGKLSEHQVRVPAGAWFTAPANSEAVEHALPVVEGGVISLVWVPDSSLNAIKPSDP
ncbi:MAG: ImmA/IrrE family metallo-endopeptidase [Kofleriaceae bacterium]